MMSFDVTCSHKSFILFVGSVVVVLVSYVKHFESLCMKCATHIKWPCLASLHAGHSKVFFEWADASSQNWPHEGSCTGTHCELSGFVLHWKICTAAVALWLVSKRLCLFLGKERKRGLWVRNEKRKQEGERKCEKESWQREQEEGKQ